VCTEAGNKREKREQRQCNGVVGCQTGGQTEK
jgi:hypothetical protein